MVCENWSSFFILCQSCHEFLLYTSRLFPLDQQYDETVDNFGGSNPRYASLPSFILSWNTSQLCRRPASLIEHCNCETTPPDAGDFLAVTGFGAIGDPYAPGIGGGSPYDDNSICARVDTAYPNLKDHDVRFGELQDAHSNFSPARAPHRKIYSTS